MGEYSGYLSPGGGMPSPVFNVRAVTHRDGAILPVVAAGEPVEENHTCWGLTISAQILWELREKGLPVLMCFCPFESAAHWMVVTVERGYREKWSAAQLIQALGKALFSTRSGTFVPK